jgi:hypothetical protein
MRKVLSIVVLGVLMCGSTSTLFAQDLLPSDAYYRDNIAVNEVAAKAPSLKIDEENPMPPGGGTGGGGWVGAPLEDAILPILMVSVLYGSFLLYRSRSRKAAK